MRVPSHTRASARRAPNGRETATNASRLRHGAPIKPDGEPEKSGSATTTAAATSPASPSSASATDGTSATLTIAEAHAAAGATPESVDNKKVRVKGVVAKLITQTAGTKSTHNVKLVPSASESAPHIYCDFGATAPSVSEGASVTFECTGRIVKNAPKNAPLELRDCTVAP